MDILSCVWGGGGPVFCSCLVLVFSREETSIYLNSTILC